MKKTHKWPVDYTKHPVYQAWQVTAHGTGYPICQMLILKDHKCHPYYYYIIEAQDSFGKAYEPGTEFWDEKTYSEFFIKKTYFEYKQTSPYYDHPKRTYHHSHPQFDVTQVFGPKMGDEFPKYNDTWRIIEACKVCDGSMMPLFLNVIYEDTDGNTKNVIAHPGDKEFVDIFSKDCYWERLMLTSPPSDGSIQRLWLQKNIYGTPGKTCSSCCSNRSNKKSALSSSAGNSSAGPSYYWGSIYGSATRYWDFPDNLD